MSLLSLKNLTKTFGGLKAVDDVSFDVEEGSVMGLIAWLLYNNLELGLVMAGATLLNLLVAAAAGIGVPIGIERLGRDPALGSSVVLTFVTDSMGFFIFLGLATLVLIH